MFSNIISPPSARSIGKSLVGAQVETEIRQKILDARTEDVKGDKPLLVVKGTITTQPQHREYFMAVESIKSNNRDLLGKVQAAVAKKAK